MAVLDVDLTGVFEILAPAETDKREFPVDGLDEEAAAAAAAAVKPTLLNLGFSGDLALNSVIVRLFKPAADAELDTGLGLGVADK